KVETFGRKAGHDRGAELRAQMVLGVPSDAVPRQIEAPCDLIVSMAAYESHVDHISAGMVTRAAVSFAGTSRFRCLMLCHVPSSSLLRAAVLLHWRGDTCGVGGLANA